MLDFPTIATRRLILRAFTLADAPMVQRLAGDRAIAATTCTVPHPYPDGAAEDWIKTHAGTYAEKKGLDLAVTLREPGTLIGAISFLAWKSDHESAEMGYWIGKPYWGQGYCTEAGAALVDYGFRQLGLNRIHATHFVSNPASGRVMQKIGMTLEGCLRQRYKKWGQYQDAFAYALLREDLEVDRAPR